MAAAMCPGLTVLLVAVVYSLGVVKVVGETAGSPNTTTGSGNGTGKTTNSNANDSEILAWHISSYITLVICVVGIISNSLLLVVTYCNPLKNLRRTSWITMTNLSLADLLTSIGTILICSPVNEQIAAEATKDGATAAVAFLHTAYSSSFFLLLLFAIERYIAVKYPMESATMVTKKRVWAGCIVCWVAAIVCGVVFAIDTFDAYKSVTAYYGILEFTVLVMILFQVLIIRNIKAAGQRMVGATNRDTRLKKISKTIIILILVLMVTAFPYFIARQMEFLSRLYPQILFMKFFSYYYLPVASLNYIVNPFIYAWRLPDYRSAFTALFKKKSHRNSTASSRLVLQKGTITTTPC